jgi:polysaccharide biosynthesis protein PslH
VNGRRAGRTRRLFAVCESPPSVDSGFANGSTLISHHLLSRLPAEIALSLAYFGDEGAAPSPEIVQRADEIVRLPTRGRRRSFASVPFSSLPRASWQRYGSHVRSLVGRLASSADVAVLHGFHTFALANEIPLPVIAHEVDPWSEHWRQRAASGSAFKARYDLSQARKAERLETSISARAAALIVVSPEDAHRLGERLGRDVLALPNGVVHAGRRPSPPDMADRRTIAFVGTLDYPPNIAAVEILCAEIFPRVLRAVPDAHLVVAGRRPVRQVLAYRSDRIEIRGDVPDVWTEMTGAAVLVFPGDIGLGRKNTVTEALSVGRPIVASPNSARGNRPGGHLLVAESVDGLAAAASRLLIDDSAWAAACASARDVATTLPSWDEVSDAFNAVVSATAAMGSRS